MTIEITEDTIGIWFVLLEGEGGSSDWMASLWREDDGIHLAYRFRYYRDDRLDDLSKDKKNWYSLVTGETVQVSIRAVRDLIEGMQEELNAGQSWEILMGERGVEDFTREFMAMPWAHVTRVDPDD